MATQQARKAPSGFLVALGWVGWLVIMALIVLLPLPILFLLWGAAAAILQPILGWPLAGVVAVGVCVVVLYFYLRRQANPNFSTTVNIERPLDQVFAFVATGYFENRPKWVNLHGEAEILAFERSSPGPMGIGTTGRLVQRSGKKVVEHHYRVTNYEPDKLFALHVETQSRSASTDSQFHFSGAANGTKLTAQVVNHLPLWHGFSAYYWHRFYRRAWINGGAAIKEAAEREIAPVEQLS